jgi:DNA-binding transcriptional LysR family regulator
MLLGRSAFRSTSFELPSNEAVRAAVEAGMGAAVMSASVAAPSIEAGLLRQVDFALPERCYYALRHAERYRSRGSEALMDIIRRVPAVATKSHNSS